MQVLASEVFVGRTAELRQLKRVVDSARAGSATTVLLTGEAGIGKIRLASVAAKHARETGFEVLIGRSSDLVGAGAAYQPFAVALRPLGTWAEVTPNAAGWLACAEAIMSAPVASGRPACTSHAS
jgi:hypothetical protein